VCCGLLLVYAAVWQGGAYSDYDADDDDDDDDDDDYDDDDGYDYDDDIGSDDVITMTTAMPSS